MGGRRSGGGGCDRTGPSGRRARTLWRSSRSMPCSPGPGHKASGRSTSEAWSPPRSPTATAGPATRICTPTSRWRTRCRPSTDAGCPSTDGCCSKPTLPPRRPTTPRSSSTSATRLGVRFAERPGTDPAKRPIREIVGVDPRLNQRWSTRRAHINSPPRRAGHPVPA